MPDRVHYRFDDEAAESAKKRKLEPKHRHPRLTDHSPKQTRPRIERGLLPRAGGSVGSSHYGSGTKGSSESRSSGHGRFQERARSLLPVRQKLPIWQLSHEIRQGLRSKDVMLLVGETGSGKSTQIPQFLVDEPWCRPRNVVCEEGGTEKKITVGGSIAITEPRRVAAITLAQRVADEMGTPLGSSSPASKVGYSVRFDNSTSPSTKVKFLTEGMLLQEMLRDPWLRQYSAVVVDEVHERGVNVDLILGFLRNIVCGKKSGRGGVPLKVAVMSATADLKGLHRFFDEGYASEPLSDGITAHATNSLRGEFHTDGGSESEWSGFSFSDDEKMAFASKQALKKNAEDRNLPLRLMENGVGGMVNGEKAIEDPKASSKLISKETSNNTAILSDSRHISVCRIEGRQYPVKIMYSPDAMEDIVDSALRTIFQINYKEPLPGDILVFLTGQETVESLEKLVNEYASGLGKEVPKLLALPLFAALPQAAQQRVFQPAPVRTRKVIIATNIAETSVTVMGVRHVIDCGKSKIKQFRTRLGLESLLCKPISKSAAIQRKGRAGREAPGNCYRLYTEQSYLALQETNTPEILRCDIAQAVLTMKARGINKPWDFPLLDPPPRESLEKGLLQLFQLGCLEANGAINSTGIQIAKLPLSAPLGRVLLAAAEAEAGCLAEIIDIISCLSVENIFLNLTSEEAKEMASAARQALYRREGDHLTLLVTMQAFTAENSDRKAWAERHYVSHRAMRGAWDIRKQLRAQSRLLHFSLPPDDSPSPSPTSERTVSILKCFLKGFGWKTALLCPDGMYKTTVGRHDIAIHPSSVLFGKKVEAIFYNEFVFTNRSYARGVSAVQMDWVQESTGA